MRYWNRQREKRLQRMEERRLRPGLVLGRMDFESIVCELPDGGQIVVTPVRTEYGRTRIHLSAPRDVIIRREELAAYAAGTRDQGPGASDEATEYAAPPAAAHAACSEPAGNVEAA